MTSNSVEDSPGNQTGSTGYQIPEPGTDPMRSTECQDMLAGNRFLAIKRHAETFAGAVRGLTTDTRWPGRQDASGRPGQCLWQHGAGKPGVFGS